MSILRKTTAWLTLTCLLLPAPQALAQDSAAPSAMHTVYRGGLLLNGQALTPTPSPLVLGNDIYLPLRWSMNALGVTDVGWSPDETGEYVAKITLTAPGYFLLQQYQSLINGLKVTAEELKSPLPEQLHRIDLPLSPLRESSGVQRAPRALLLVVSNGSAQSQLAVYDYLLVDGQYYLSDFWFNQLFGADIAEAADKSAVTINAPELAQWQRRLDALQDQVVCREADDAIGLWMRAQKTRSGALQYALLSPQLQQAALAQAQKSGWTTGSDITSFGNALITDKETISSGKLRYALQFSELLADSPNKTLHQKVLVEKIGGRWLITQVEGDIEAFTLLRP